MSVPFTGSSTLPGWLNKPVVGLSEGEAGGCSKGVSTRLVAPGPWGPAGVMWLVLWLLLADGSRFQTSQHLFIYLFTSQSEPLLLLKDAGLSPQDLG